MPALFAIITVIASLTSEASKDVQCAGAIIASGRQHKDAESMKERLTLLQFYLGRLSVRSETVDWNTEINQAADAMPTDKTILAQKMLSCAELPLTFLLPKAD